MQNEKSNKGLCSTCNHIKYCTTLKIFKGRIIQCEEFDDSTAGEKTDKKETAGITEKKNYLLKGLCENCDFAETCTLLKPDTGVWFCNEYQ